MATDEFRKGAKIERWEQGLRNPDRALKRVGLIMVAESLEAFDRQGFGGESWKGRRTPNVMGIIADFARGASEPKSRRFQTRPALVDTGRLRSSISYHVVGSDTVEVGSNVEYAGLMHGGGESESEPITENMQASLRKWLANQPRAMKKALAYLTLPDWTGKTVKKDIPARPFVGVTDQTREDVKEAVGREIFEVGKD